MSIKCRICETKFFDQKPILTLDRTPSGAQSFLTFTDLKKDKPHRIELYQCKKCGTVQLVGGTVPYYKDVIRATSISKDLAAFRKKQLDEWVKKNQLYDKTILEIGSGMGDNLPILRDLAPLSVGLENKKESVNYCEKNKLKVIQGFLEPGSNPLGTRKIDAFVTFNFLEHWPDPSGSLEELMKSLTSSFHGIIEVPNFDMILKKKMFAEITRDHLTYFTRKSLKSFLDRCGFEVINIKTVWNGYILSAQVTNKPLINVNIFEDHKKTLIKRINKKLSSFKKNEVAVWGAGHQSLTLLSLGRFENQVSFVIDSAPFKQNRFTPVTHLRIESPAILDNCTIKAILIIAGSYNNEIEQMIIKKYQKQFKIFKI